MPGPAWNRLEKYDKSLDFYQRSLTLRKKTGDTKGEAITLSNIAHVYKLQKKNDTALVYYQKALALEREIGFEKGQMFRLNSIGDSKKISKKYKEALDSYHPITGPQ